MVKVLSGANQTSIAGTFHDADVLVEMLGISKKWSTKTRSGYETRIIEVSAIRQTVDPLGGIAKRSDFKIVIQQETPTQFIQDLEADHEGVDVYLQYASQAKIPLIKGKLDRWELAGGLLALHCIASDELPSKFLLTERVLAANFATFAIPERHLGKWVPLTLGNHDQALGYMIDRTVGQLSAEGQKVKFNAAVSGHEAVGSVGADPLSVWADPIKALIIVTSSPITAKTAGHVVIERGSGGTNESKGLIELVLRFVPKAATKEDGPSVVAPGLQDPENAIDEDESTFADAANIAPNPPGLGNKATVYLRGQLPDLPFPQGVVVTEAVGDIAILTDIDRDNVGINTGGRTGETCEAAIELLNDTYPTDAGLIIDILADTETAFDNLHEMTDGETDLGFTVTNYVLEIGEDTDNSGAKETLPVKNLGGRNLALKYTEDNNGTERLRIREWRLRVKITMEAVLQPFYGDVGGYDDDGSGTYTGTASQLIENPADMLHFVLAELLSFTAIDTASFTTARTDLGGHVIAGQVLEHTPASEVLPDLLRQGKLKLYRDFNDDWAVKAYVVPGVEERHLDQAAGDFVTSDGNIEGEIVRVTQSPLDELYNQFEILYQWNEATKAFDGLVVLDETTSGPVGGWLTESQGRYNLTRKLTVEAKWIRTENAARSYGNHLIYQHADRKRLVTWQASLNAVDLEIGDRCRLSHPDLFVIEDTTVYSGYRAGDPLATIKCGYTDPDTSAVIKCGAKVQLFEGRHRYEIYDLITAPMAGVIRFTGRQADVSRAELPEPF